MSTSSSPLWNGTSAGRKGPFPRRSLEIGALVVTFIYWWPLAVAYVAWKIAGYPAFDQLRDWGKGVQGSGPSRFAAAFDAATGRPATSNSAFEAYRRAELDRLEARRRALEEESRDFTTFVEELKRTKDREEFDAFMARRRPEEPSTFRA